MARDSVRMGRVSLTALSYIFSSLVQYLQASVSATAELERRLSVVGEQVGVRVLHLLTQKQRSVVDLSQALSESPTSSGGVGSRAKLVASRSRKTRPSKYARERPLDRVAMLQFVHTHVWTALFDRAADRLEKSTERNDEYYIFDSDVLTNRFISVPKDLGALNCAAFVAGIIKGVLDRAEFSASVDAHFRSSDDHSTTIFVIRFDAETMNRNSSSA